MYSSRFLELVRTFTKSEWKQFRMWVKPRLANRNAMALLQYIDHQYPAFEASKMEKQKVYRSIFKKGAYNDQVMRHLINELNSRAKEFLIHQVVAQDEVSGQLMLLAQYRQRHLPFHFQQTQQQLADTIEQQTKRNAAYYYNQFQLHSEYNKFLKAKQQREIEPNIQQVSDSLDAFFIASKLQVLCEAANYQNIVKVDYHIRLEPVVQAALAESTIANKLVVQLYHAAWLTISQQDAEIHFERLSALLTIYADTVSGEEFNDLHVYAKNYCIKRINKGDKPYIRKLFGLYQMELQNRSAQEDMAAGMFKNIVSVAFGLNELEWAKEFMEKYAGSLPADIRDDLLAYNRARYYFEKRQYTQVVSLLSRVEYNDLFTMLGAKGLLLKTYFELDDPIGFDALVNSFKVLLRNKKLLGYHRENYTQLIKFAVKIHKATTHKEREQIRVELEQTKAIIDREWLISKLYYSRG